MKNARNTAKSSSKDTTRIARRKVLAGLAVLLATWSIPVAGFAAELTAEQIAERIVRDNGFTWEGAKTRIKMVLLSPKGAKEERLLEVIGRRHEGLLQTVVRFVSPSDVAGTAFLMREKKGGGSEQHIYLPGLHRTRRIVGREQEGSFMGSDFTYADLQRIDPKFAKHKRLPDEEINGAKTFVIESIIDPSAKMQYGKMVTWVRQSDYVPLRTRYYDDKGKTIKTLYTRRVREVEGKPVIVEARMQSANGHATELDVQSLEAKENLPDSAFVPTALER